MRFFRRNKTGEDFIEPLTLTTEDGESWMEIPGEVENTVRQAIARIMRIGAFPDVLVTISAIRQEGVTYISRSLGAVLAKDSGHKICVVELNWWWPSENPETIRKRPGVADVLMGDTPIEDVLVKTNIENLSIVTAGRLASNLRSTMVNSDELNDLMANLSKLFDHVILDLPPVTATSDAILLAALGTDICLVINQGVTPVQRVRAALDDLDHLNIVGVIMNQVNVSTPSFLLDFLVQE